MLRALVLPAILLVVLGLAHVSLAVVLLRSPARMSVFLFDDRVRLGVPCPWPVKVTTGNHEAPPYCPTATGFFTGFRSRKDPARIASFLATARHVASEAFNVPPGLATAPNLFARFTTGRDEDMRLLDKKDWLCPKDPKYDVAIYLGSLPLLDGPEALASYATEDFIRDHRVSEGDQVLTVAMVPELAGAKRNFPVVRQGTLALLDTAPDSPGQGIYYYAEAQSFPGNSGAPVYLMLSGLRGRELSLNEKEYLIGVNAGHVAQPTHEVLANIGLQRFTRVDILLRLFCSPEARQHFVDEDTSPCDRLEGIPAVPVELGQCSP